MSENNARAKNTPPLFQKAVVNQVSACSGGLVSIKYLCRIKFAIGYWCLLLQDCKKNIGLPGMILL